MSDEQRWTARSYLDQLEAPPEGPGLLARIAAFPLVEVAVIYIGPRDACSCSPTGGGAASWASAFRPS